MVCSISALRSCDYYLNLAREDYYLEGGEPLGEWAGGGAKALGLRGHVAKDDLRALFAGRSPDGKLLVQKQKSASHAAGWDLTFSCPKSFSIAWALADPESQRELIEAHKKAVLAALQYLEDEHAWTRRGKGGKTFEQVRLVAALHLHSTSRAMDMNVHTHALVVGVGVRADGTTGTIVSRELYRSAKAAGAVFRLELARLVKELGFDIERGEHSFEVASVGRKVIDVFSKRSKQIEEQLAVEGLSGPKARELAALSTRQRKGHVDRPLFAKWSAEAKELGFERVEPGRGRSEPVPDVQRVLIEAARRLSSERGAFHERDLLQRAAVELEHTGIGALKVRTALRTFLKESRDIELLPEKRVATKEHLAKERSLIELVERSKDDTSHVLSQKELAVAERSVQRKYGITLNAEQRGALRHITMESGAVKLVEGLAGTGKTTLLRAARLAWEKKGFEVIGVAVAKGAADNLKREAGIQSSTLAALDLALHRSARDELKHHTRQLARVALGKRTSKLRPDAIGSKTVLVIDESSMVATEQLSRVLKTARERGAKVVCVGDSGQLGAVERAGGAFASLAKTFGAARLEYIRRQQRAWQREASLEFAQGNMRDGLSLYAHHGRVTVAPTRDEAKRQMVDAWAEGRASNPTQILMLAGTRQDVAHLNRLAQQKRKEAGELGRLHVTVNGERFHAGDRVRLTKNSAALGFTNGDIALVERVVPAAVHGRSRVSLVIDTPGEKPRRASFELRSYDQVSLGYASTVHAAQGLTRDRALVLAGGPMMDRELTYVSMTRHREDALVFVSEAEAGEDLSELVKAAQKSRAKETALDFELEVAKRRGRELQPSFG